MTLLMAIVAMAAEKVYTPNTVPNVHEMNREWFVSDPDSLLSAGARDRANATLRTLMDSVSAEVAIVVLPSIGDDDIFNFAQTLATQWELGKRDKNNGLLVLFDLEGRQVRIHTGKGMEGVLPDAACNRLIDDVIVPRMRDNDLDGAVTDISDRLYEVLTDPDAAAEIISDLENDALPVEDLVSVFLGLALLVGIGTYIALAVKLVKMRRLSRFERAVLLRTGMSIWWILAVLSLGIGLPALLFIYGLVRYYRNAPRKCDVCGTHMHKLPEDEDNQYLTPAQDLEENLKSVDYDVWLCPKCSNTEIFPFTLSSSYRACPHCGARAYAELYNRVEREATATVAGRGVRVYGCKNCGYRHEAPYTIAKTAPVVIVGGGGGSGSGGGFSGGSWGGGSFGGGGASGGW